MPDHARESDNHLLVQVHGPCEHCGGGVQVESRRGGNIVIRKHGRHILTLLVRPGEEPWLPDALRKAVEHATSEEAQP